MILMPHGGFKAVTHEWLPNSDINQLSPRCRPFNVAQGDRRFIADVTRPLTFSWPDITVEKWRQAENKSTDFDRVCMRGCACVCGWWEMTIVERIFMHRERKCDDITSKDCKYGDWGLQMFYSPELSWGPTTTFQSGWGLDLNRANAAWILFFDINSCFLYFLLFVAEPAIIGLLIPSLILLYRYLTFAYKIFWYREEFIFFAHKTNVCFCIHQFLWFLAKSKPPISKMTQ